MSTRLQRVVAPLNPYEEQFQIIASELRKTVRTGADVLEAASRFGVVPSTIRKILEGRTPSSYLRNIICANLDNHKPPPKPAKIQLVTVARLKQVHRLFRETGTLAGAGRELGLTRERIRQLLLQGSQFGLFDYKTYKPPVIPKKILLEDYKRHLTLTAVAKIHGASIRRVQKLMLIYGITPAQRHALRVSLMRAAKKHRLIARYRRITRTLGHHPNTAELYRRSKDSFHLVRSILCYWGSFHAFQNELGITSELALQVAADRARTKKQLLVRYRRLRKRLGYDPTTTQLTGGPKSWHRLHEKIRYWWGSMRA
jgi:hypothetical protein